MFVPWILVLGATFGPVSWAQSSSSPTLAYSCVAWYLPLSQPAFEVTSVEGLSWLEMERECRKMRLGYSLIAMKHFSNLTSVETAMCPNAGLLPIGNVDPRRWYSDEELHKKIHGPPGNESPNPDDGWQSAVSWPGCEEIPVDDATKFHCAICQVKCRSDVLTQGVHPPHNNSIFAYDLELVSKDSVKDVGLVGNGSDLVNKLLGDLAEAFNISVTALRWHGATLNGDQKAVVHVYYDSMDFDMSWFYYVHWNDQYLDHVTVPDFEITMIQVNTECLPDTNQRKDAIQKSFLTGAVAVDYDPENDIVFAKECYWDDAPEVEAAVWSPSIEWRIRREKCDMSRIILTLFQIKGSGLALALKSIDIGTASVLQFLINDFFEVFDLLTFVTSANGFLLLHTLDPTNPTAIALLYYSIPLNMAKLFMQISLKDGLHIQLLHTKFINVLIADGEPKNPLVGLALTFSTNENMNTSSEKQINYAEMSSPVIGAHIVVTVSDSIAFSSERLAIVTFGAHNDYPGHPLLDTSIDSWMAIVQVSFTRHESHSTNNADDDFVDIAFKPSFRQPTQRGKCAERDYTTDEWFQDSCRILKSLRDKMIVCRCKKPRQLPNITTSTYLLYGFDASLSTYLSNNRTLVIVVVMVCIMSALGLFSVAFTAVFFPDWMKDQGHKIFLQMILALAVNLVLGFVNNFISVDTKSVSCIGIGVARHYSFLAMFCWMMVLSGLQVKRLTTISGAKATTHLILKVSLVAWGLPLVPIVIMLAWDIGFYKSEVSNRGYCYPEGLAFQVTVQAPAGVILAANLIIFLIILNHIYGWFKCGKEVEVRKHTDDRAEQLRRLGMTIFIFFLFGFTWLFHFLSEEGIINSEFLFEFMFLITAAFHLFMLSLFFIVLDKGTRTLWKKSIRRRTK